MTLEQVNELGRYWSEHPHTSDLVALLAQYCGVYKPQPRASDTPNGVRGPLKLIADRPPAALQSMKSRFAGGAIRIA